MWRGHELFVSSLPLLVEYIPATLFYFLTPTVISLVLGALICRVRVGKKNPLYWLVSLLVSFFRGTPGLVQIYIVFFGLPKLFEPFGININRWDAGIFYIIATCCNFSSFVSEAFRGAYEAIDKDQTELQEAVNKAIDALTEDGTLSKLTEEFFGEDNFEVAKELGLRD